MTAVIADWSQWPDVDRDPGKCSRAWCVKGTRVMVEGVIDNAEAGCTAEEIATEIYETLRLRCFGEFWGLPNLQHQLSVTSCVLQCRDETIRRPRGTSRRVAAACKPPWLGAPPRL